MARCHMMHMLKRKRTKGHTVSIKQGKNFPHKVANLVQDVWALYL